jgi:transposase
MPACAGSAAARHARRFPDEVTAPVRYGACIAAPVVYLLHFQLLPEKRLAALMADPRVKPHMR